MSGMIIAVNDPRPEQHYLGGSETRTAGRCRGGWGELLVLPPRDFPLALELDAVAQCEVSKSRHALALAAGESFSGWLRW